MRYTKHSMRSRRTDLLIRVLSLLLAAVWTSAAMADGNVAFELNGGLEATDPAVVEAQNYEEDYEPDIDMVNADCIIGYVAPQGASLNPVSCTEWSLLSLNQLVFESVVDLDASMKPVPMLADSWEQDGRNWKFKLRSGIQFHNGRELTAYDVVRSYEAINGSIVKTPYFGRIQTIEKMDVLDNETVAVTGKNSGIATLYAMNFPVMQYSTLGDQVPRGTGPYWYIHRDYDDTIRLESNPLWWKHQPLIHSVLLKRYDEAGDALEAIQTNKIQMMSTNSPKAAFSRKLSDVTSMDYLTLTYEMLVPNLSSKSMMSDISVRQAVMYAIDRSMVASNAYVDMAVQCEVPLPPTSWLYESQSAIYYYSPERALQLMNNLGWRDMTGNGKLNRMNGVMLQEPNLTIITYNERTNSIRENAAKLIASYLEAVGFNVTVTAVRQERLRERMRSRDYDLALIGVNLSEVPDLSPILGRKGDLNYNGFGNDNIETLFKRIRGTTDETKLKQAYAAIQMYVVERLPIMGLVFRTGTVLSTRSLGGMSGLRCYDAFNGFEFLSP